jgi:hypothetical protein
MQFGSNLSEHSHKLPELRNTRQNKNGTPAKNDTYRAGCELEKLYLCRDTRHIIMDDFVPWAQSFSVSDGAKEILFQAIASLWVNDIIESRSCA